MSVIAGDEFPVNTTLVNQQVLHYAAAPGAIAMDRAGDFVVTWQSDGQDGAAWGVFARLYDKNGTAKTGEIPVNTTKGGSQIGPTVAMDADGDFVVTWSSNHQPNSVWAVYGQRYNAAGVPQGTEFRISQSSVNSRSSPSVAMDADGDFVVSWESDGQDGSGWGVFAQRYNAEGVPTGSQFQVNTITVGDQDPSRVAMTANGDFVVAWAGPDDDKNGIYFRRYNADGTAKDSVELRVNTEQTGDQFWPAVAVDATGDFVVAWASEGEDLSSWGIYQRRFNAAGVPQDIARQVNTITANSQNWPTVAMDAAGNYVITWSSIRPSGSDFDVYARRYNAAGVSPDQQEFPVNTTTANDQKYSSVAMDPDGDFVVAWTTYDASGNDGDVHARRFDETTHTVGPVASGVYVAGDTHQITEGERLVTEVPQLVVAFSRDLSTAGGATGANSVTNPANWQVTRTGKDISNRITGITFGLNAATGHYEAVLTFATPLTVGHYVLTAKATIQDTAGLALDGNYDATSGDSFSRSFSIAKIDTVGDEFRVNRLFTTNNQTSPEVGMDSNGDFVVAWSSYLQDGSGWGAYYQWYNAVGEPRGNDTQVNSSASGNQDGVSIAVGEDGRFVVAWQYYVNGGNRMDVRYRVFDADGRPVVEDRANLTTADGMFDRSPAVAIDHDGDFVITWYRSDGLGYGNGIYARRFSPNGSPRDTVEFPVNFSTSGDLRFPDVAMDEDGDFVVTWEGWNAGASAADVYARRFDSDGRPKAPEVYVNSYTAGKQASTAVAMDADGDFVVAWESYLQDGSLWGVFAKRYSATGAEHTPPQGVPRGVGNEFRVNTYTTDSQGEPSVGMDADGDFVISWEDRARDGSAWGIFAQRYNSAGVPQGSEFRVNSHTPNNQQLSSVAMDADGGFVVTWASYGQASEWDVYAQRFGAVNSAPQANAGGPYSVGEGGSVVLDGSGSFDPDQLANTLTYQWDLDGDGIFGETGASATRGDEVGVSPTFRAAALDGPGSAAVTLKVTDDQGATDTDVMGVTIGNVPPTATFSSSGPVRPNQAATVRFTGASDSAADTAAGFHYSFAETVAGLAASYATATDSDSKQFAFPDVGSHTVWGRIFDKDNGFRDYATTVVVEDPPTVTNVTSSKQNGPYKAGEWIPVEVTFSKPVSVTGSPGLLLETGTTDAWANYSSGSGGSVLVFNYTVGAGEVSADLDYQSSSALAFRGGTIRDAVGNDAVLTLPNPGSPGSLGANKNLAIDTAAPAVTNVTSPTPNASYKAGILIPITVTFSEAVAVTGTPQLTLETGTVDRAASYANGSGSPTLTFNYTVQSGDASSDLDYVNAGALVLNGGTIRDAAGNNAALTLPLPGAAGSLGANKNLLIDALPPTAALADPSDDGTLWDRRKYIDVTFSDFGPSGLDAASILDSDAEFTLTGPGAAGVAVNGSPQQTGATFRYSITGSFTPGYVDVNFTPNSFRDALGNGNDGPSGLGFTVVRTVAVSDAAVVTERARGKVYASFVVNLVTPSTQPIKVYYATGGSAPGTAPAVAGRDYAPAKGWVAFKPGETTKTRKVRVRDDLVYEDAETFLVTLSRPQGGGTILAQSEATGTILDNDPPPRILFNNVTISEGKGINVMVSLSRASGKPVSVHYATADVTATGGIDYLLLPDTLLTFAPGETKKTIRLTTIQDQVYEGNEKFVVNFGNAQNATLSRPSLTATIKDNDPKPRSTAPSRLTSPALAIDAALRTLENKEDILGL